MRSAGWSKEERTRAEMDRMRMQSPQPIRWRIYAGPLATGEKCPGFVARDWGAWCIPLSLWNERDRNDPTGFVDQATGVVTFIRFEEAWQVFYPDPERWHIVALPPGVVGQRWGRLVPAAGPDRSALAAVPDGAPSAPGRSRIENMKAFLASGPGDGPSYPVPGDVWNGRLRQGADGGMAFYGSTGQAIFALNDGEARVGSGSVVFETSPDRIVAGGQRMNPLGSTVPSTAVMPQTTFVPYFGEVIAATALVTALMKILNQNGDRFNQSSRFIRHPAETLDYEALRKEIS